jgi:hypothetical protein
MSVDTKSVSGRRQLHFDTIDDILAEVERLNQGKVRNLGNWSPGQVLMHISRVMNGSLDGIALRVPWWIRFFARLFKKRFLKGPMPAGFRLPDEAAKTLVPGETSWEEGLQALRQAIGRLKTESQRFPSPVMGEMTAAEWNQLHCRHSEMHLSFLVPD